MVARLFDDDDFESYALSGVWLSYGCSCAGHELRSPV